MAGVSRFKRRNRVDEPIAAAVALIAGLLAVFAGAEPTGAGVVDFLLITLAAAVVVWAAASAPWWAPALACGVGASTALNPLIAAIGAIGFVGGLMIGVRQQELTLPRTLVALVAVNVLIRSDLGGFQGLSAIIGVGVCVVLLVAGVLRRPAVVRRRALVGLGVAGAIVVIALGGLVVSGSAARPDLTRAANLSEQAIDSLNAGDYQRAATEFADASAAFARTDDRLGGVLALPGRLIPGIAQNVSAGADLSAEAAAGTNVAANALASIDPATLTLIDGAIDLDAVAAVEAPLLEVQNALVELRSVSDSIDSPWLVGPLQDQLAKLDERLDDNEPLLANAIDAVQLSPQILGADGARRYLIMFTTPAELRGITGFMGNFAEVTVDDGRIDVTDFGRRSDLSEYLGNNGATCDGCPQDVLDHYGQYGLAVGPEREFFGFGWLNITMPRHFPFVAEVASIVYPQSGGAAIDGVIAMDPYVIQALMAYTGPVTVPELGVTVGPEDAAQFILEDQYVLAGDDGNADRIDALDTIGREVIVELLTGALPVPSELARNLGPLVTEQRLLAWTADPDEQELFDRIGLLGALPALGDDGGFGFTVVNGGNSKIDVFLARQTDVRIETGADGQRLLVADVKLTNGAPAAGLPTYVISNSWGLPKGTSRMLVTLYGPSTLRSLLVDGETVEYDTNLEAGWTAYSRTVDVGPGGSVTFRLEFELGAPSDGVDAPVLWQQPLADRSQ